MGALEGQKKKWEKEARYLKKLAELDVAIWSVGPNQIKQYQKEANGANYSTYKPYVFESYKATIGDFSLLLKREVVYSSNDYYLEIRDNLGGLVEEVGRDRYFLETKENGPVKPLFDKVKDGLKKISEKKLEDVVLRAEETKQKKLKSFERMLGILV
jgi:hypothetical protein